jgi:hypothetical protein
MDPSNFLVTWPWILKAAKYASFYIAIQYLCYLYTLSRNDEMMQCFLGFKFHWQERSTLVLDPISSEISVSQLPCLAYRAIAYLNVAHWKWEFIADCQAHWTHNLWRTPTGMLCLGFLHRNLLPPGRQLSLLLTTVIWAITPEQKHPGIESMISYLHWHLYLHTTSSHHWGQYSCQRKCSLL